MRAYLVAVLLSFAAAVNGTPPAQTPAGPRVGVDWPGFRGIAARGIDDHAALPLHWSVPDAKAVRWRVPIAGLGHSSPIVWGDQVCTASAVSGKPDFAQGGRDLKRTHRLEPRTSKATR